MSRTVHQPRTKGWAIKQYIELAGETGMFILISDADRKDFSITLIPTAGTLKCQFSTSLPSEILAGTATWNDTAAGAVGAKTSFVLSQQVTALRCVGAGGGLGAMEVAA